MTKANSAPPDRPPLRAVRGEILYFTDDPAVAGAGAQAHFPDGLLLIRNGLVDAVGPSAELLPQLPAGVAVDDHRGKLILPGFIDTHVHYAQLDVIASPGEQLLSWLQKYTFPAEARFANREYAEAEADVFCDELLRNGTTTALAFATVHPGSADALFAAARRRRMRMITGKVLMDRHCPDNLCDLGGTGETETRALIERWHGRDRLGYAVTPRFPATSSAAQMEAAGRLFAEYPGLFLQSHLAENREEVAWIARMHPGVRSYLDVFARFGQLGPRSVLAHCIWIDDEDRARMAEAGAAISFCPTSNLFLGSGLFDLARARAHGVRVGMGTDVGAGTSLSMLQTLGEAYKILQLQGQKLGAEEAFYLATLGGARSLYLDACIGSLAPGREADFVVLDPAATPLIARRMAQCATLAERLFVFMTLGDDRAIHATYILGEAVWRR